MPNWVKNIVRIEGSAEDISKAIELMRDKRPGWNDGIDFSNIVPMPKQLNIIAGGGDRKYVALYLKTLSEAERVHLRFQLTKRPVSFYDNYYRKYMESFTMDVSEGDRERMTGWLKDYVNVSPKSLEDVGKAYIDNILEHGHDTWYEWCCANWGTKWNACEEVFEDDGFDFQTAWCAPFPVITALSQKFPNLTFHHRWADEDLGSNCGEVSFKNGEPIYEHIPKRGKEAHEFACETWGYDPEEFEEEEEEEE